jgi:hypothetical protein
MSAIEEQIAQKRAELADLERQRMEEIAQSAPDDWAPALHVAVSAIYFEETHKYRAALYDVVKYLSPKIYELVMKDERAAYRLTYDLVKGAGASDREDKD